MIGAATPMVRLAITSTTPSTTKGLYSQMITMSRMNQVAQRPVLPASSRLTTGLAASSSSVPDAPAQNITAKNSPMNTRLVPRSGCSITRTQGTTTTIAGLIRSTRDVGGTRYEDSTLASIIATAIFANSEGCSRNPPTPIHPFMLAAVPAPDPMKSVRTSSAIPSR